ncbi:hypothetical protein BJV82DRAFT_589395 [Fennellomyces sp. T-0311]|nr:hypothetical protein BJV82DRAFT_589395 [Fennellomyces sp. T-0311]
MINDCCMILILILLPPLGVFFMKGCGADFWINLCLTILGYIPGHLHGFYVLIKERERRQYVAQGYSTVSPPAAYGAAPTASAPPPAPVK